MDIQRLLDNAITLQSIPAPTFQESSRANELMNLLLASGKVDVDQTEIGNVYARIPGNEQSPIIISAHLDTVFQIETPLETRIRNRRLYGPGIGDNAVALATLIELAHLLPKLKLKCDVWLVGNVGEEGLGNLNGMREVVERFSNRPAAYLILEGMALGYIYHKGLPVRRYKVSARTSGGHAWIHNNRPSALHKLMRIASNLVELSLPTTPKTTLNIGRMQGGRSINSIADHAAFEIELRSESDEILGDVAALVRHKIEEESDPQVQLEIESTGVRPAGSIAANHPLVSAAIYSLKEAGLHNPTLECGSTDANLPLSRNLPAICIGITSGGDAHTTDEYIEIEPIKTGITALLNLIEMIANEEWITWNYGPS